MLSNDNMRFATIGFTLGGLITYAWLTYYYENLRRDDFTKLKKRFTKALEDEVAEMRLELKTQMAVSQMDPKQDIDDILKDEQPTLFDDIPTVDEPEEWDYEKEELIRNTASIYTITHDEFFMGGQVYTQSGLIYFEEDDVLTTSNELPVDVPYEELIGSDELRWGYGSKNPNVVYIRNEDLGHEFEVTRELGSYSELVLGFTKKSKKSPKFGGDDY